MARKAEIEFAEISTPVQGQFTITCTHGMTEHTYNESMPQLRMAVRQAATKHVEQHQCGCVDPTNLRKLHGYNDEGAE